MQKLVVEEDGNFCLQSFLNRIQVSIDLLTINQENLNLSAYVAQQCWTWLSQSQTEPYRSIWKFIMDKDANFTHINNLQSLKYLSYSVQATAAKVISNSKRLLMVLPFRERHVAISYKNLLADEYGPILGLHWMMPILSNISYNNELYFLEDYLDPLNTLIENDIISKCFLETGAAGINIDSEHLYSHSKAKAQVLSEHRKTVEQQIHSSSMIKDS